MSPAIEIQLIAVLVAIGCALPGCFLVLRRMAMLSDAITHSILLGIVLGFFATHNLRSPLLIIAATLVGVLTVWLTELLARTRLVAGDASIGIVFPLLFSIAIILISRYAGQVHLDTDAVLLGELAFAPFDRLRIAGVDIGAQGLYTSAAIVLINLIFIAVFYKELKLASFDPLLAALLGLMPGLVHYGLMTLVSLTAVASFQAVGSILVVAFMVGPPISAYLLSERLSTMLGLSALIGTLNALLGYRLATWLDASIAGSMAAMTGLVFAAIALVAPQRGLISSLRRRRQQRQRFARLALLFHLYRHGGSEAELRESRRDRLAIELNWEAAHTERIMGALRREGLLEQAGALVRLTPEGRDYSRRAYRELFED